MESHARLSGIVGLRGDGDGRQHQLDQHPGRLAGTLQAWWLDGHPPSWKSEIARILGAYGQSSPGLIKELGQ